MSWKIQIRRVVDTVVYAGLFLAFPTYVDMHAEYLVPCTNEPLKATVGKNALSQSTHRILYKQSSKAISVGVLAGRNERT